MSSVVRGALPTVALASTLLLAGCGALSDSPATGRQVVAAFYPLEYVAERVAGDHFEVGNLVGAGAEPHDLELDVRETADLSEARLVLFEQGFQPAVDAAVEQNAEGEVLDVTEVVELQPFAEHEGEGHEHEEHADDEADEHEHGDTDPHFWQDPIRMAEVGEAVAEVLGQLDADHADEFTANAADLRADLEELDREYADGLTGCDREVVVVNHDAFGYLSKYGVHLEPIVGLSPEAEPTPADLARIQGLIRRDGITTVFAETLVSRKTAETLAEDLDITTGVLDPVEGLSDDTAGEDYLSLMRSNLAALRKANGC